jgi:hypothetical protein
MNYEDFSLLDYELDLEKIVDFSCLSSKNPQVETEITDGYEVENGTGEMVPINKLVREIKSGGDAHIDNIRYDLVKYLVSRIVEAELTDVTEDVGLFVVAKTLYANGMLKKTK